MNKKQTEQAINLVLGVILFLVSVVSVSFFINGTYANVFGTNFFLVPQFFLFIGTALGVVFGIVFTIVSVYGINDARVEDGVN